MGWKQYVRQVEAANRRHQRESVRRYRALVKQRAQDEKLQRIQNAASEAEEYETYIQLLQSLHTECGPAWDWASVSTTPPPPEPIRSSHNEQRAAAMLNAYQPGFFAKLFGGATKRRAELEADVQSGRGLDQREYDEALITFQREYTFWRTSVHLAPLVMKRELAGCRQALALAEAFDELGTFKIRANLESMEDGIACVACTAEDSEIVPNEELKLTAGGKLTKKEMAVSKYWPLYQDHICSTAIRTAREVFATLPVERAIVNVRTVRLNPATGHLEPQAILGVHFVRSTLGSLRLEAIDPSDAMKNFPHRMKFKKATGFEIIEPVEASEQWVTT